MAKPVLVKSNIPEPDLTFIMKCQAEFNQAYAVPKNGGTQELYIKLIEEEHEEWIEDYYTIEAKDFEELKELADLFYVTAGLVYVMGYEVEKAFYYESFAYDDSITDLVSVVATGDKSKRLLLNLIYCICGYAASQGWHIEEAYKRVHKSNMSKLDDNGNPLRREDGKVLKGPNYKEPFLEDLTDGN